MSNLFLVIIDAAKSKRFPTNFEIAGLVLGLVGTLELVIPEFFRKLLCPCLCKPVKEEDDLKIMKEH